MTAYPPNYPDQLVASLSNLPPTGAVSRYVRPVGSDGAGFSKAKGNPISFIELICQTRSLDELDTRIRINLQQALIQFIKDENQ